MTTLSTLDGPTANLVETYFRLAQATPGSSTWRRGNLQGCTGPFSHPICNFAVAPKLDDRDLDEARQIALGRDAFHLYLLPSEHQVEAERRLPAAGLRPMYRLRQLVAEPLHALPSVSPIEATTHGARLALARFMVNQFFMSQPKHFREGIARTTARAGGLDLYAVGYENHVVGGVMFCREGSTLGIYNLCVASEFRNQGWGRAILDWCRICAGLEGRIPTLQCDERLIDWYKRAGFAEIGQITAFGRPQGPLFDTM